MRTCKKIIHADTEAVCKSLQGYDIGNKLARLPKLNVIFTDRERICKLSTADVIGKSQFGYIICYNLM